MPKPDAIDLPQLASDLLFNGALKILASQRRVRIHFNHVCIADTTNAIYVWEKPFYPYFYVPSQAFGHSHVDWDSLVDVQGPDGRIGATQFRITVGRASTDRIIVFEDHVEGLGNYARVEFDAVDQWFEEDAPIYVHPKDPFKRIDTLPSTRHIKVSVRSPGNPTNKVKLADTPFAVHLHETGLPTRYYMPMTAIPPHFLRNSSTTTQCPYKGTANYFDVVLPGKGAGQEDILKDLVWYYELPTLESSEVRGLACFYNEKVDIEIDGVAQKRPNTHFG